MAARKRDKAKQAEYARKYRLANREKALKSSLDYDNRNPEKRLERQQRYSKRKRVSDKMLVFFAYGGAHCACCGETEIHFLTIDHIHNDGAKHRKEIGANRLYQWIIKNGFPEGFQVLCCNCNRGKWLNGGICPHKSVPEFMD